MRFVAEGVRLRSEEWEGDTDQMRVQLDRVRVTFVFLVTTTFETSWIDLPWHRRT